MHIAAGTWQFDNWLVWLLLSLLSLLPIALRLLGLVVVPAQQRRSYVYAWLLLILFVPVVGWLLYLLLGSPKLNARRRAQQQQMDALIATRVQQATQRPELAPLYAPPIPPAHADIIRLSTALGGLPPFGCNDIELHHDYTGTLRRIAAAIDAATHMVHVQYFMFADDESGSLLVDALIRAQARGVKTRVLVDQIGNFGFNKPLVARLSAGGVEWHYMLPISLRRRQWNRPDLRNHRKIVVIDGVLAFTGSQNAINNTYNKPATIKQGIYYEEVVAEVRGPLVQQLEAVFITDWFAESGELLEARTHPELGQLAGAAGDMLAQVVPSGPGHETDNNLHFFIALVHAARTRLVIITPYFVPDVALLAALQIAARRGVQVTVIVSGIADQFLVSRAQWSYYEELLLAGVELREANPPVIVHTKSMSVDNDLIIIGSSNMNSRSLKLDMEVNTIWYSAEATAKLRAVEAEYLARSTPVRLEEWRQRPWQKRFVENLARLFTPLV